MLDLSGDELRVLYMALVGVFYGVVIFLRFWLTYTADRADKDLSAYELAVLAVGPEAAVEAAVAHLLQLGVLSLEGKTLRLSGARTTKALSSYRDGPAPAELHPLEQSIVDTIRAADPAGLSPKSLGAAVLTKAGWIETILIEQGLIVSPRLRLWNRVVVNCVFWPVLGLGVVTLVVGGLEFAIGMLGAIAITLLMYVFTQRAPRLTQVGDARLAAARLAHVALKTKAKVDSTQLSAADAALVVGLFGPQLLPNLASVYESRPG